MPIFERLRLPQRLKANGTPIISALRHGRRPWSGAARSAVVPARRGRLAAAERCRAVPLEGRRPDGHSAHIGTVAARLTGTVRIRGIERLADGRSEQSVLNATYITPKLVGQRHFADATFTPIS